MTQIDLTLTEDTEAKLLDIAKRYRMASRGGIQVINALGGQAENWMTHLPAPVRDGMEAGTEAALRQVVKAAQASRGVVGDPPGWVSSALGVALGAAGGFGGASTALAELPVTTALLFRIIQGVAAEYEFNPSEDSVAFDCLTVFVSAGPLSGDDGADTGFFSARLALNGVAFQKILQTVAPRLATALGQKLAAQAVPVLGAAAGAAINYTYASYYREMAHVHFSLRRLAVEADLPERILIEALRREMAQPARKS